MTFGETPGQGCQNGSKNWSQFCHVNTMKCLLFVGTTVSDCKKTDRAARRWKQPPKKPFHHVSRDKILHDSWSISAALARSFFDRHFERGESPGDEVEGRLACQTLPQSSRFLGGWWMRQGLASWSIPPCSLN